MQKASATLLISTLLLFGLTWNLPAYAVNPYESPADDVAQSFALMAEKLLAASSAAQTEEALLACFPELASPHRDSSEVPSPRHRRFWNWLSQQNCDFLLQLKESPRLELLSRANLRILLRLSDDLQHITACKDHSEATQTLRMVKVFETIWRVIEHSKAQLRGLDYLPVFSLSATGLLAVLIRIGETTYSFYFPSLMETLPELLASLGIVATIELSGRYLIIKMRYLINSRLSPKSLRDLTDGLKAHGLIDDSTFFGTHAELKESCLHLVRQWREKEPIQ